MRPTKAELEDLYLNRGLSSLKIAKLFTVDKKTILNWLKKFEIPRRFPSWRKYDSETKKRVVELYKEGYGGTRIGQMLGIKRKPTIYTWLNKKVAMRSFKAHPIPFKPVYDKNAGYIIGAFLGDGNIFKNRLQLVVKDRDFADAFKDALSQVIGRKLKIWKHVDGRWTVSVERQRFIEWIKSVCANCYKNLKKLLAINKEFTIGFIRGFFDAEGSVYQYISKQVVKGHNYIYQRMVITVYNTNEDLLMLCKDLLRKMGIKGHVYKSSSPRKSYGGHPKGKPIKAKKQMYILRIVARSSIEKYFDEIGFSIRRKQEKFGKRNLLAFLDFDTFKPPLCWMNGEEARERVMVEVRRLKDLFNLGTAIIRHSDNGWHVKFSKPLTRDELDTVLREANIMDHGYRWWAGQHGGMECLRTSPKAIVVMGRNGKRLGRRMEGSEPTLWEVIE